MKVTYLKTTLNQKFPNFRRKMTHIGFGIHAHVYSDGEFAYKQGNYNSNYVKWLLNLRRNRLLDNPHVPEVYEIFVDKKKDQCLIKMELLTPGKFDNLNKKANRFQDKIMKSWHKMAKFDKRRHMDVILSNISEFVIRTERGGGLISLDLHGANIMLRHRQMVITDPVV